MTGILIRIKKFGYRDTDTLGRRPQDNSQRLESSIYKPKNEKDRHQPTGARRGRKGFFSPAFGESMALNSP